MYVVLLHNGGFYNTCTMKRCLHRKVDFKTNALNNAHFSELLYYKAGLLPNDGVTLYFKIKTNSLLVDTSHKTLLVKVSQAAALSTTKIILNLLSLQLLQI